MKPQFALEKEGQKGEAIKLVEGHNIVGRRDPNNPDKVLEVLLEDPTVSKQHARIEVTLAPEGASNHKVVLLAFETPNKTKINRKKVLPKERVEVKVGDELNFGKDGPYKLIDLNGVVKEPVRNTSPGPKETSAQRHTIERVEKRAHDEKISLTNPEARFWVDKKIKERMNEDSILNKHQQRLKEQDNKRARLEQLNSKRVQLEEKSAQLKALSEELNSKIVALEEQKSQTEKEVSEGRDNVSKTDSYQKALEGFSNEVQKKITGMQNTFGEKNQIFKELTKKEFIRQYEKEEKNVKDLRDQFWRLCLEIDSQRAKLRSSPQKGMFGEEQR